MYLIWSESVFPRFSITEWFLLLQACCNLSKLFLMEANFEFFRNILIFVSVWLVIFTPFRKLNIFFHQNSLLNKFSIIFSIGIWILLYIFQILLNIGSSIFMVITSINNLACWFFCLFVMDSSKFMHLLKMFLKNLSL